MKIEIKLIEKYDNQDGKCRETHFLAQIDVQTQNIIADVGLPSIKGP